MRRSPKTSVFKLSGDSLRLVNISRGQMQSASRLEERGWERLLDALLQKLLRTGHQESVDNALEHLFKTDLLAYDTLMEAVEACSETCVVEHEGNRYDALLIAAPILAWTRFAIASGSIPADMHVTLSAHLHAHLLADGAELALAPTLYSIDQLPRTHAETLALTQRLAQAAVKKTPVRLTGNAPETAPFLADTRYLVAAVVVPANEPIFKWQSTANPIERETAFRQWKTQATSNIATLLPGCNIELLLPEAYYVACREADKLIRPASIRAAVNYLTNTLSVGPQDLRAIIGSFSDDPMSDTVDEYRIGFALRHMPEVMYGVVWPLYGQEDSLETASLADALPNPDAFPESEQRQPIEEILTLLRQLGVVHIKHHAERFPMELCDDCGAPLYPDPEGELVHAEMPDDLPASSEHFH